jgi:ribosomal protein L13E
MKPMAKKGTPKPSLKRARITELVIHGSFDDGRSNEKPLPMVRNPWVPSDVIELVEYSVTFGATSSLVGLVKAGLDYRKAKRIHVKVGECELTIERSVSDRVLEKRVNQFKTLIQGAANDDIKVSIPKGADRRMPLKRPRK